MTNNAKRETEHSPVEILTELAIEGTSSLVEVQRTLLTLAQQENDIILNGFKERFADFIPAVAVTDLVRRSLDTLIGLQQEFLTITSKQTLNWFDAAKDGKIDFNAHVFDFAREEVDAFVHAQKELLDVLSEETAKVAAGKRSQHGTPAKKTEWSKLAREAADAFLDAQRKLLDVLGQQVNVNLDAAAHAGDFLSPAQLLPVAKLAGERVKNVVDAQTSLIGSIFGSPKGSSGSKQSKPRNNPRARAHAAA